LGLLLGDQPRGARYAVLLGLQPLVLGLLLSQAGVHQVPGLRATREGLGDLEGKVGAARVQLQVEEVALLGERARPLWRGARDAVVVVLAEGRGCTSVVGGGLLLGGEDAEEGGEQTLFTAGQDPVVDAGVSDIGGSLRTTCGGEHTAVGDVGSS